MNCTRALDVIRFIESASDQGLKSDFGQGCFDTPGLFLGGCIFYYRVVFLKKSSGVKNKIAYMPKKSPAAPTGAAGGVDTLKPF